MKNIYIRSKLIGKLINPYKTNDMKKKIIHSCSIKIDLSIQESKLIYPYKNQNYQIAWDIGHILWIVNVGMIY
jgi:hypothetical protein